MANRMKGEASFTHDGNTHTVRVTMAMLLECEDETGVGLLDLMQTTRVGFIATMLRHGLAAAGGRLLARDEAAELLVQAPGAREAVRAAIDAAMPAPQEDEGNGQAAKPTRGTGTKS